MENEKFNLIKTDIATMLENMTDDADKFYVKGQKAAGIRLRKAYKEIGAYVKASSNGTMDKNKA